MEQLSHQEEKRRARNLVWAAAQDYAFDPEFLSFAPDGTADLYLNSIIGLVRKWYQPQEIGRLFHAFDGTSLQEVYDNLLWLGLENGAYARELPERPVLAELRREYARRMLLQEQRTVSAKAVYALQALHALQVGRWKTILGEKPSLSPKEKKLLDCLSFGPEMDEKQIDSQLRQILREYFRFDPEKTIRNKHTKNACSSRFVPFLRASWVGGMDAPEGGEPSRAAKVWKLLRGEEEASARAYAEACFGKPLYSDRETSRLERELCTGSHQGLHLYFTRGEPSKTGGHAPAALQSARAEEQFRRNRAYYDAHEAFHRNLIAQLSSRIQDLLFSFESESVRSRSGRLSAPRVWRPFLLGDGRAFCRRLEHSVSHFTVDLLLDGSASQLYRQEIVAAQGYIIAESLRRCGIPVQVCSFCSLQGLTVLRRFRSYDEDGRNAELFRFFAAGWNRDGLAFRGISHLIQPAAGSNRLLIVLTDASPNDDHKLPGSGAIPSGQDYTGLAAALDARQEVLRLKKRGVRVVAVLPEQKGDARFAHQIYGGDFVRIPQMNQFASVVGDLVQKQLVQITGSL